MEPILQRGCDKNSRYPNHDGNPSEMQRRARFARWCEGSTSNDGGDGDDRACGLAPQSRRRPMRNAVNGLLSSPV